MAATKQLYDGQEAFQPYVEAINIPCGVIISTNSVKQDIEGLQSSIQSLLNSISGGDQVSGSLGVEISYANLATSNIQDAQDNETWSPTMNPPNTSTPYTWKKTIYTWNVQGQSTPIKTTYEITATALFPETQVMYIALETVIDSAILGPANYGVSMTDQNGNQNIVWHNYFTGISPSTPFGYMAIRHRDAGQEFPTTGTEGNKKALWNISLFSLYPMNQQSS